MGIAAPEQVKTPYWTSFPAPAISGVDWDNHEEAHRAVMRMFPRDLGGPAGRRRSAAGILFRYDNINGVPTVIVQSNEPPEMVPSQARVMSVPAAAWELPTDSLIEFRLTVNPVRRFRGHTRVVGADELPAWLGERIAVALDDVTIMNDLRRTSSAETRQKTLSLATVDAVGRVVDGEAFETLRRHGVGRSKSYGAGLLTARRVG